MMFPIQVMAAGDEVWLKYDGYIPDQFLNEKAFELSPLLNDENHRYILEDEKGFNFDYIRDLYIKSSQGGTLTSEEVKGAVSELESDLHEREVLYGAINIGTIEIPNNFSSIELQYKYKQYKYIHAFSLENIREKKVIKQLSQFKVSAELIHLNKQLNIQSENIERATEAIKASLSKDIQLEKSLIHYFQSVGESNEKK
ncbi:hypothetical protein [uncultured Shewanella sp.]|uniref:hypothetical protein n=1 Tax=uncultured Shewanella sp. TaxID=173975 RepID=UPI002627CDA3|nr:hypothetical protein [uncultured Shewanella sp.]